MPYGLSAEEAEWVRAAYRMFRERDPAFMERYAPDARITAPPTLPAGGTYDGPFEALEFWNTIGELFEDPRAEPENLLRSEDRLVVLGTWSGRSRETGKEVKTPFVHTMRMDGAGADLTEQRIISFELFIDTAAILDSLR